MTRTSRLSLLPVVLVSALLAGPAMAASVSAAPDRFMVTAGETFDFVLSLTDGESWEPPDVTALTRDFDIVDRRRASHAEMVNGKPVHVDQWVMTLQPKRTGTLTLPSLTLGGLATAPTQVQVVPAVAPAPSEAPQDDEPLFVRLEAGDTPAFVQSDVPVTIRIYDGLGLRAGAMEKPVAEGATFTPEGGQRSYVKTIGKRRYRVIEQSYLMRPQRSGTITIPPVALNASVPGFRGSSAASDLANILGRSGMGGLGERPVTVKSRPVSIAVQARPVGVTGWFLPARGVTLSQAWSTPLMNVKVGDTLTRTITLAAKGASPNQLPPLDAIPVDGLRQYADDSRSDSTLIDGMTGAVLTKRFSVVPTRPGPVTLPAMEVAWWNLATNKPETAVLPAVTLNVEGTEPAAAARPSPPAGATAVPPVPPPSETPSMGAQAVFDGRWREALPIVGLLAGALAAAAVLFSWLRHRSRAAPARATELPVPGRRRRAPLRVGPPDRAALMAALMTACRKGDARAAHDAYAHLARLGAFKSAPDELERAAEALARHLYGGDAPAWSGRAMLAALRKTARRQARAAKGPSGARLAPLYPAGR